MAEVAVCVGLGDYEACFFVVALVDEPTGGLGAEGSVKTRFIEAIEGDLHKWQNEYAKKREDPLEKGGCSPCPGRIPGLGAESNSSSD